MGTLEPPTAATVQAHLTAQLLQEAESEWYFLDSVGSPAATLRKPQAVTWACGFLPLAGASLVRSRSHAWPAVASTLFMRYPEDFFPSCRADQGMPSLVFGKSVATAGWAETSLCVSVGWTHGQDPI